MENFIKETSRSFFHYHSTKILFIRNKKIGALYRFFQLFIFCFAFFAIVLKKSYQEKDVAISTVTTKLKGIAFADFKNFSPLFDGLQVFDAADYVIPPQETDSFFVMTNMIITPNQTQGICPEDINVKENLCSTDADCQPSLSIVKNSNGVRTGLCVRSDKEPSKKVCAIQGWCPTENTRPRFDKALLASAKNFTVLIKNQIRFPKFDIIRRNIAGMNDHKDLKKCFYNKSTHQQCPKFRLGDIINYCGDYFDDVAVKGAVYGIIINWNCDFDYSVDNCIPSYDFRRLDDPNTTISPGYNFRFSQYYVENNKRYRVLTKAYGLKFEILVNARAGKFSLGVVFFEVGSAIALFAFANWICDFVVIVCLKDRKRYKEAKIEVIEDDSEVEHAYELVNK